MPQFGVWNTTFAGRMVLVIQPCNRQPLTRHAMRGDLSPLRGARFKVRFVLVPVLVSCHRQAMEQTNRQWLLARRPQGMVTAEDFRLAVGPIPTPGEGEILVRNRFLSCDPTQRGWMAYDTYLPVVEIGDVMRAVAIGEVQRSNHPDFHVGQIVQGLFGWQEWAAVAPATQTFFVPVPDGVSLEIGASLLGLTGLTAFFGLIDVGQAKPSDTVLVSGAAGATGQVAGQIAKILGCRVVGIAGGPEKCARLVDEWGFDAAIDYKHENLLTRLRKTCPNGVDLYFDNVGGDALDAALLSLALHGRIVLCGAMSTYNLDRPAPGPRNYLRLLTRRGSMQGFLVSDHLARASRAIEHLLRWHQEGRLKQRVDVVDGFENAPAALARLFTGENQGKQLVRIG
jgi:NADPH-dependent curcumin reductase